jgi:O-antigen/teichoic acid export membrane protein
MSLKRNVLANYAGQFYAAIIGVVLVPLYMRTMGTEAYGLVGFYGMLQGWFALLDMGLASTLSRETARFRGGAGDALRLRRLLRVLEGVFVLTAVVGAAAMIAGSGYVATRWLRVEHLPAFEVQRAIMLMAPTVALRWMCGLYRGAITGFERLVWLSGANIAIATARFVLVVPFLFLVGARPTDFFGYQLVVAVAEVAVLVSKTYRLMPARGDGRQVPWQWGPLRPMLKFSMTLAFTTAVWVLVTQTDKLILSKLLVLSDYAAFTLAVQVASGVSLCSAPIGGALLPRLTRLNANGDEAGLVRLYRNATQVVAAIAMPAALVLAAVGEQVLWAWTGNSDIAHRAAPVLMLYALGNGVLALAAFPYYLQFAKGDLRFHLIGNALFVVIYLPLLFWASTRHGMVGAGCAWVIANGAPFIAWSPFVHARFVRGLHVRWVVCDVGAVVLLPLLASILLRMTGLWPSTRLGMAAAVGLVAVGLFALGATGSSWVREFVGVRLRERWVW